MAESRPDMDKVLSMPKTNYHLHLTGYVGGYDFDRSYVDYILGQNKDKEVNVLIDSLGGSLATALSIASAFRNHGNVNVHFVGMNASAATIASLGAKHVSMDASAMYLAHKCSTSFFEWGSLNSDQLQNLKESIEQMQTDLDKMDANVAQMYSTKCKDKNVQEVLDLMKVGGWLTAKEAFDWGFVDEITEWEEAAPVLTDKVACAMTEAGIPLPNIPSESKEAGSFTRFLSALTSFFHSASPRAAQPTPSAGKSARANCEEQFGEVSPNGTTSHSGLETDGGEASEQNPSNPTIMKKIFSLIGAILSVEAFAFDDKNNAVITDAQLQSIEDALKQNDDTNAQKDTELKAKADEITALQAQVEALKKKPAEDTTHVVNNGGESHTERNSAEEYVDTLNSARDLFNILP